MEVNKFMANVVFPTSYKQKHYKGLIIDSIPAKGIDGIQVVDPDTEAFIEDCIFDFRNIPTKMQDEVISSVNGPRVHVKRCVILGGIKALLCGNGDHPEQDAATCQWDFEDCIIIGSGRRCPEAQHGTRITMERCWIHDWGLAFDVRAFGAWAHSGGSIYAKQCLFTRSNLSIGFINLIKDRWHHFWQSLADNGIKALIRKQTYISGIWRGLTSDDTGIVFAQNCYKSNSRIVISNCNTFLDDIDATLLIKSIIKSCPDTTERLGLNLINIWNERI